MITLIGQYDSPFVRRVAVALNHYATPFERRVLSVFKDFDAMLELNPLGKVPVLELDDGERLFDSRYILDYLETLVAFERSLLPRAEPDRRRVLNVEAVALGLAEKTYERGIEFARRSPGKTDPAWAARLQRQINSSLEWLEALQPSPWFYGSRMTRADVTGAVAFTFLKEKQAQSMTKSYPALKAHCARCEELSEFSASPYSAVEAERSGWRKHAE